MPSRTERARDHLVRTRARSLVIATIVALALWALLDTIGLDVGGAVGAVPGSPAVIALLVGIVVGRILRRRA